jgi:hypothetical protein
MTRGGRTKLDTGFVRAGVTRHAEHETEMPGCFKAGAEWVDGFADC